MSLETPTLTAAPVWESTFDECIERRAGLPMEMGDSNRYCGTSLGEHFKRMSRAARSWTLWSWRLQPLLLHQSGRAECIDNMQNSVGGAYGVGDSNRYCGTGLGKRNALTICIDNTHTQIRTHYIHTHTHYIHTHTYTHRHTYTRIHTYTHICTHERSHVRICKCNDSGQ